jgi:hypothetical protein
MPRKDNMTAEQLLARWPNIRRAVAWVELFAGEAAELGEPPFWDDLSTLNDPGRIAEFLRGSADDEIRDGTAGKHRQARAEMDHPDFVAYLAGKLESC